MDFVQAQQVVSTKKEYHAACIRNGLRMPDVNSKICTQEFMAEVRNGLVYVPKLKEVVLSPCPKPPTV